MQNGSFGSVIFVRSSATPALDFVWSLHLSPLAPPLGPPVQWFSEAWFDFFRSDGDVRILNSVVGFFFF